MHPSRQGHAPAYANGFMAGGPTIHRPCTAFLAYPYRNYAVQPEWYDTQHHTMLAPVVEPNGEGLDGATLEKSLMLTLSHSNDKRVHVRR